MEKDKKPLFVIDANPTVDWPVIVKLPADGGWFVEYLFTAKIKVLSPADYDVLCKAVAVPVANLDGTQNTSITLPPALTWPEILADNARKFASLIVGWDGPADPAGNPVPFTPEVLAAQVTGPRGMELSAGLWAAINEIRFGARLKNSEPPSIAG